MNVRDGALCGREEDGVRAFLGIPFAAPPVGERRFAAPQPPTPWTTVLDASRPGPAVPQPPGRLNALMGKPSGEYSEERALTLNVWAPAGAKDLPVLFWLHGGAWVSGSAGWGWYSGARLAAEHEIVVVTANYRLGVLGYLCFADLLDGLGDGNFGLLDQMAALEWTAENVAAFGGDPGQITVGGHSAGAHSAALLAASPRTGHLAQRLIFQSGGITPAAQSREQATSVAAEFLAVLRLERRGAATALRDAGVDQLLAAQVELISRVAASGVATPFGPVADAIAPAGGAIQSLGSRSGLDVLTGWTRDELFGFARLNPAAASIGRDTAIAALRGQYGDETAPRLYARYEALRPTATPAELVAAVNGDRVMLWPALRFAEERAARGETTYVYRFDWAGSAFGACHCVDLPFTFDHLEAWGDDAGMLGDVPRDSLRPLARAFSGSIGRFVRTGRPATPGAGGWTPYRAGDRSIARFDTPGVAADAELGRAEQLAFEDLGVPPV
ncbi:carboxylesterase/lipase family protein [Dactylosporangium sp. CA-092794]|uniref:carboxylesterase/lipase family protein n=1 Tax=Dactylosporangium sp. CA-092794 TaxID=3239929 RepID=UPI003D8E2D4F